MFLFGFWKVSRPPSAWKDCFCPLNFRWVRFGRGAVRFFPILFFAACTPLERGPASCCGNPSRFLCAPALREATGGRFLAAGPCEGDPVRTDLLALRGGSQLSNAPVPPVSHTHAQTLEDARTLTLNCPKASPVKLHWHKKCQTFFWLVKVRGWDTTACDNWIGFLFSLVHKAKSLQNASPTALTRHQPLYESHFVFFFQVSPLGAVLGVTRSRFCWTVLPQNGWRPWGSCGQSLWSDWLPGLSHRNLTESTSSCDNCQLNLLWEDSLTPLFG